MPAARRRHPRFFGHFDRLFDRLPVRISTSDLHHWILRKKIFHIRAYDFGVQFSFNKGWMLQFAVFIRRCHRKEAPSPVCNNLKATSHGYQTRDNKASYCPYRPYTISGSKCFSARGPPIWNALPVSFRVEKHLVSFKNKVIAFVESRSNFNKLYGICFSNTTSL